MKKLGKSVFIDWEEVDLTIQKWAKEIFTNDIRASVEREETVANIVVVPTVQDDFEAFKTVYAQYDPDGEYNPEDDFEVGERSEMPALITLRIMAKLFEEEAGFFARTFEAGYNGVVLFEESAMFGLTSDTVGM